MFLVKLAWHSEQHFYFTSINYYVIQPQPIMTSCNCSKLNLLKYEILSKK